MQNIFLQWNKLNQSYRNIVSQDIFSSTLKNIIGTFSSSCSS
jgi:hypothetical protein